jgi:hypothetical protein
MWTPKIVLAWSKDKSGVPLTGGSSCSQLLLHTGPQQPHHMLKAFIGIQLNRFCSSQSALSTHGRSARCRVPCHMSFPCHYAHGYTKISHLVWRKCLYR